MVYLITYIFIAILDFLFLDIGIVLDISEPEPGDEDIEELLKIPCKRRLLLLPFAILWPIHWTIVIVVVIVEELKGEI